MGVKDAFERIAAVRPEPVQVEVNGETATVYLREPSLADKVAMTGLVTEQGQIPVDHDGDPLMDAVSAKQMMSMLELKFRALARILCDDEGELFYESYDDMAGTLSQEVLRPLADRAWEKYGLSGEAQADAAGN